MCGYISTKSQTVHNSPFIDPNSPYRKWNFFLLLKFWILDFFCEYEKKLEEYLATPAAAADDDDNENCHRGINISNRIAQKKK